MTFNADSFRGVLVSIHGGASRLVSHTSSLWAAECVKAFPHAKKKILKSVVAALFGGAEHRGCRRHAAY
jgi:hypothetical protein